MILRAAAGIRGLLVNADTGQPIRHVRWADLDTGAYECLLVGGDGRPLRGPDGKPLSVRGQARLRFEAAAVLPAYPRKPATPLDECRREVLRGLPEVGVRPLGPGLLECQEKGCHARATMEVADEQEVEPHVEPDGRLFERAITRKTRHYCSRHYRYPTLTSQRGVEAEVPVRPGD